MTQCDCHADIDSNFELDGRCRSAPAAGLRTLARCCSWSCLRPNAGVARQAHARRQLTLFMSADASAASLTAVIQAFQQLALHTADIGNMDADKADRGIAVRMHGVRAAVAALEAPAADQAVRCAHATG